MDPSGPWAYSYNRIAVSGVPTSSGTTTASDFHQHNLTTVAGQTVSGTSPAPSAILLQPANTSGNTGSSYNPGFMSSNSYTQVFNPIFQHSAPKPAHYNSALNSNRQTIGTVQVSVNAPVVKSESPRQNFSNHGQQQNFYTEQSESGASTSSTASLVSGATLTWQGGNTSNVTVGDPFSLLSQENIIQTESQSSVGHQNNYGSQYHSSHSHLNQIKVSTRSSSPQTGGTKTTIQSVPSPITAVSVASSGVQPSTQYYRQASNIVSSYSDSAAQTGNVTSTSKSPSINPSSLNQTCILVTTTPTVQTASNQNITNQRYIKKQNMYNNAARSNAAKNSQVGATNTSANLVANVANNNSFGIQTSTAKPNNHTLHLIQTKAQSKVYPELVFLDEEDRAKLAEIQQNDPQDGSISYYTIIDGRLAYTSANANLILNESSKGRTVSNIQSPRQFVLSNNTEIIAADGSRIKTEPNYSVSPLQNECTNAAAVPRKQSPSHSTSSQAASPAYPIYNSPMNSIESPSQHSASSGTTHSSSENSGHIVIYKSGTPNQAQIATQPTLDISAVSRNAANNSISNTNSPVVYSSVITRALVNEQGKVYTPQQSCWENDIKPKKFFTINSGSQNEIVVPTEIQLKPAYYETVGNNIQVGALHTIKTEETQLTENILVTTDNPLAAQVQITPKIEEQAKTKAPPPKSRRRKNQNTAKTREQLLSENEFLVNRVPPPAHNSKGNTVSHDAPGNLNMHQIAQTQPLSQQQNGGTFYDQRWNAQQNVTQQVGVAASSNISNQLVNFVDQQIHQQQQQPQQQPQQALLTQQASHNTQYSSQTPYYTGYHPPSSVSGHIAPNQHHGTAEVSTNSPISQIQTSEPSQKMPTQITQNSSNSEIANNTIQTTQEEEAGLKVVVPNIEEELEFLSSEPVESGKLNKVKNVPGITPVLKNVNQASETVQSKSFKVPNSTGAGFMASYLKFLQGERDGSPPPFGRAQRKPIFQKNNPSGPVISAVQILTPRASVQNTSVSPLVYKASQQSTSIATSVTDSMPQTVLAQRAPPQVQASSTPNSQQQHLKLTQQVTPVPAQAPSSKPMFTVTSTITKNFAATQTVNKKRKAITEIEAEQNQQHKPIYKPKNVAEIAVQTASHPVMLPKKARPQMAMQMASMQQQNKPVTMVPLNQQSQPSTSSAKPNQSMRMTTDSNLQTHTATAIQSASTYRYQPPREEDPLNLPPRRATSFRKAKTRGIEEIMQKKFETDEPEEPQEFADSDTDPVWTPEDEEEEQIGKLTKRKPKRPKTSYSRSRKPCSNILTAAVMGAGIDDSDGDESTRRKDEGQVNVRKLINSPKDMKQEAIKAQESSSSLINTTRIVEEFKTGELVILRSDLVKDWPVLWQVDGKSILQMFEPFSKDGKILYKNMSKYAAWNNESKRLYVRAPVVICSQSSSETIVELNKSELYGSEIEQYAQKCSNDYLTYRENFDVYVQTLISQSLDQNFFTEITKEKDEYFLSNIKIIEDIMANCKRKLLSFTHLAKDIIVSIETWPHFNIITDLGRNSLNQTFCGGCRQPGPTVRFLLYGQPYKFTSMIPLEPDPNMNYERDIQFCQSCKSRAELLHKIVHEKYNLYQICSRRVEDQQIIDPGKATTAILNDLLADSDWIDQLFSDVRNSWVEVESLDMKVRSYQVSH